MAGGVAARRDDRVTTQGRGPHPFEHDATGPPGGRRLVATLIAFQIAAAIRRTTIGVCLTERLNQQISRSPRVHAVSAAHEPVSPASACVVVWARESVPSASSWAARF